MTVDVAGSTTTWPFLSTYSPRVNDVVWLAGPPGSWVCIGTVSGIGRGDFTTLFVGGGVVSASNTGLDAGPLVLATTHRASATQFLSNTGFVSYGGGDFGPAGDVYARSFVPYSDRRLKRDPRDLDDADSAALFAKVRPRRFDRDPDDPDGEPRADIGFIAQELPADLQVALDDDGTLGYDLSRVVAVLAAELARLRARQQRDRDRLVLLEERLTAAEAGPAGRP